MRNRLILAISAIVLVAATPALAWPFGKKAPATGAAAIPGPTTNLTGAPMETVRKASNADVQQALRSDPLTQAAFFANQFDRDPTDAQMGLYLSNALRALGRNAEAADTAHKVLLFQPNNIDVLTAAAQAHIADNNAFYAVDPLQRIIGLKPNNWQAYSLLGVAYDQIKRTDDAQTAWATALKLSPNNPDVLTNMAMARVMTGDLAGAEPLLRTAAAQKTASIQVRQNLALVLGLEGQMAEAEKLLREDLPPEQAEANLAWLQLNQGKGTIPVKNPVSRSWDSVKAAGS